jgi:hypothetical protein
MRYFVCILLAVPLFTFGCVFQKAWSDDLLTRNQAVAALIEQVITPMVYEDYYMAFGPQQMLTVGDRVEPEELGGQPYPGSAKDIEGPTWFFWVDTDKWARFAHLVHFVYIDASHPTPTLGDGIVVEDQGWWPNINGVDYLDDPQERWTSSDIVYGEAPTGPPTVPPRGQ